MLNSVRSALLGAEMDHSTAGPLIVFDPQCNAVASGYIAYLPTSANILSSDGLRH